MMHKNLTEETIRQRIEEKVLPKLPKRYHKQSLDSLIHANKTKNNGAKDGSSYVLNVQEDFLFLIEFSNLTQTDEPRIEFYTYSEIQGIEIKKENSTYTVQFQFKNGRNYVCKLIEENNSQFPKQEINVARAITTLESKNLKDMTNKIHRKSKNLDRFKWILYFATLIIFVYVSTNLLTPVIKSNHFRMIVISLGLFILHGILYIAIYFTAIQLRNRRFLKEYNPIMEDFREKEDYNLLLESLKNMREKPKTNYARNLYNFSLSTAYIENKEPYEALACLEQVDATKENMVELVYKQKLLIQKEIEEQ